MGYPSVNEENLIDIGKHRYYPTVLRNVILAERAIRETVQREEAMRYKTNALLKAANIESNDTELETASKQLRELQVLYHHQEHALFLEETKIDRILKASYDRMRNKSTWFMREELVRECSDLGGCCSRNCGCCGKRHMSNRNKGRGHCTTECWCCSTYRGFELPQKNKDDMREAFIKALQGSSGVAYLLRTTNSFFCPPKSKFRL